MVLVRVAQDDRVDPAIPRRDPPVEGDEQAIGIGAAVDEEAPAPGALDEDRIALPDVEDRDPGATPGRRGDHGTGDEQRADERDRADASSRPTGRTPIDAVAGLAVAVLSVGSARPSPAGVLACRVVARVRRDHTRPASARVDRAAATTSSGGARVMLANGRLAASVTIADQEHGGSPNRVRR